ncbi:MAG: membrane protein insertase YidC [Phycisphaerales bacterium]
MLAKPLRIIIPLIVMIAGLVVVMSVFKSSRPVTPDDTTPPSEIEAAGGASGAELIDPAGVAGTQPDPVDRVEPTDEVADDEVTPTRSPNPVNANALSLEGLRFRTQPAQSFTPLGSFDDPDDSTPELIEFSPRGAGVRQITLRDYYKTTDHTDDNRYELFDGMPDARPALALRRVILNGKIYVDAIHERSDEPSSYWREIAPGEFIAEIVNENDEVAFAISRVFDLGDTPGEIEIRQSIENRTGQTVQVVIEQWGPSDLDYTSGGYGDYRRFRFGYLDPRSAVDVLALEGEYLKARKSILDRAWKQDEELAQQGLPPDPTNQRLWPNPTSIEKGYTLSWVATTNRYFSFAVYPHLEGGVENARSLALTDVVDEVYFYLESFGESRLWEVGADATGRRDQEKLDKRYVNLKLVSPPIIIDAGDDADFSLDAYVGALDPRLLAKQEPYRSLNLRELVVYQLGCAWCTFQWLGRLLLSFLRLIEGEVIFIGGVGIGVHDWALAIIILVLCVRSLLHPLTKRGQVSMHRFSKKMGKVQPEMKRLQEKYKDNPKKLQQEQIRLYREHNINPAGCLGMAPMFLQMPIWVALYAMLYFAVELRHEPAFYGLFQLFGGWTFLADLSQPDRFLDFGRPVFEGVPVLGGLPLIGSFSSLNILPILMGAIFYFQQKYLTPQTQSLSPEMETQQKIMRIVFPLMFPLMLYLAPSGLNLYILTSSTVGILESRYIRAHVESLDLENEPTKPAKPAKRKAVSNRAGNGGRSGRTKPQGGGGRPRKR